LNTDNKTCAVQVWIIEKRWKRSAFDWFFESMQKN